MKKLALVSAVAALVITETGQAAVALDPQAIDLEPFRFIPTLLAEMKQDSNIYSLSDNEVSSFVTVLKPTFDLVAQDRDNLYTARYGIIGGFYGESDNNYLDHVFSVNAHVEPTGRFRFDVGAGYNFLHEDLGSGFTDGGGLAAINQRIAKIGGPDTYNLATLKGGIEYGARDAAGQVALSLDYGQTRYDENDAAQSRDNDLLNGAVEFRLRVMPKTKLLLNLEYAKGSYDYDQTARVSDYTENRYLVGVMWENSANTSGKLRVGSNQRDKVTGSSKSRLTWDVGVVWTPLERSKFTLDGSRRFSDGNLPTTAIDGKSLTAGWNHEWSTRWQSRLTAGLGTDDHDVLPNTTTYQSRTDDFTRLGFSVNYQMRRWLVLGAGAAITERDSSGSPAAQLDTYDYDRKVVSLNAQLSL